MAHFNSFLNNLFFKFINKCQKEILRCAPPCSYVCDLFISFRTWVICQTKKRPGFYTLTGTRFINNSRSNQNKRNPTHPFVDIGKTETCAKFQQKILISTVVGARQIFQFIRQITWFPRNIRTFPKFKYWILHHLISIMKLQNN